VEPVYEGYFADPFVWRHEGFYYAIGTGLPEALGKPAGKVFPLLQSNDFVCWHYAGQALIEPECTLGETFWAPEVAWSEGKFYLYYSVGHGDAGHQLRVAISPAPWGPYHDLGHSLLDRCHCPFAIDPHPFRDSDGQWYLFYARDFLETSANVRAGTALMVARMRSMIELENEGQVVLRARSDWQRFRANRLMYGRVWDWHTLEGPSACRHAGQYYCFYSGGRWENETYGVDYGVAEHVMGPYADAGNESGPRVLRSEPHLIGPGHNSIILGPDKVDRIVFHAWDEKMTARRMFVERLLWLPEGPRVDREPG
jgi:beta-xylosidase